MGLRMHREAVRTSARRSDVVHGASRDVTASPAWLAFFDDVTAARAIHGPKALRHIQRRGAKNTLAFQPPGGPECTTGLVAPSPLPNGDVPEAPIRVPHFLA